MAKNSIDAYGASGKTNVLNFEPGALHLINDPSHLLYDERIYLPLNEATILNIMELGVLEPIIVWKDPETGLSCVVDGRQRVRHALEANKRLAKEGKELLLVPGVVKRGSAVRMSQFMVSANEIRQADTPLGRAKKMAALLERGHDESDLALLFGCGIKTVLATLALLNCTQVVQDAVEANKITVTQARRLANLKPDVQREKVQELVAVADGTSGHTRAKQQREVMGDAKPRLKSRREITKALDSATGDYAAALRWVLGDEDSAKRKVNHA
ncbi:hypothetical protein PMPD1_2522 [Paramixta manurensis]|uniref:ParB/Spo0J HTH domain-containing protein n=1 Tax=Paramixta manurensis TaxID=2740817 RepID=A0A6M8UCY6_9GAMM|nr:hypothetical protein PMPD1_2522 [Erwiniaceae bacterium PD-1]